MDKQYYTYILTNKSGTLYVGMTNNIRKRVFQHKQKIADSFTKKYNIDQLLWYYSFRSAIEAIETEKKIKGWTRMKKIALIKKRNPEMKDLSEEWYSAADVLSKIEGPDPSLRSG
jgi:putative endonuclease